MTSPVLLGLIGYPLKHSFSKKYFSDKFRTEKILGFQYDNYEIPRIEEVEKILRLPNLKGLNVTIPYKKSVLTYTTHQSKEVLAIGACNCIHVTNERTIIAHNTDILGIEHSLLSLQTEKNWRNKNALVLGTGGASLAVQFVLQRLHINYLVVSRSQNASTISYEDLLHDNAIVSTHTLIINTTPLGTFPNVQECPPIPYDAIGKNHYLFDLIYNPAETKFLNEGKSRGAHIINGLLMLHAQAEASWKIWRN